MAHTRRVTNNHKVHLVKKIRGVLTGLGLRKPSRSTMSSSKAYSLNSLRIVWSG